MWSEAELCFEANKRFADNVRAMSGGRIDIEVFSSGALMPYTEYFDAVRGGVVELSNTGGGYWTGKDPAFSVVDAASILIGDYPRTLAWCWEGGGMELLREQYAKWGSALVPPIIVNNLEEAENAIADTMSKLQATLNAVYGKTIIIPELEEGSER